MAHDDSVYPVPYSHGWEGALKAVYSRYPNMFSFYDFPCPENPQIPSHLVEHSLLVGEQTPDPDSAPMETHDGVEEETEDQDAKEDEDGSSDSSSSSSSEDD